MEGFRADSVSRDGATAPPMTSRPARPWVLKGFALFAAAVMVLVVFSQNVNPEPAPSGGDRSDEFDERVRRLTVAEGPSESPEVALGPDGTIHVAWVDGRDGSVGVYVKSSRNDGFTFGSDR